MKKSLLSQFHYGSIQIEIDHAVKSALEKSQFHYGSIQIILNQTQNEKIITAKRFSELLQRSSLPYERA